MQIVKGISSAYPLSDTSLPTLWYFYVNIASEAEEQELEVYFWNF